MATSASARRGRRPGASGARDAILDAARLEFAAHGYRGATMRGIAQRAGVDTGLIRHYFGRKDALFAQALMLPDGMSRLLGSIAGGRAGMGERLASAYLSLWEDPETRLSVLSIMSSVLVRPDATEQFTTGVVTSLVDRASAYLPADAPGVRLGVAMSHLLGIALARHVIRLPPVAALRLDEVVAIIAPTVQRYLTEPLPGMEAEDGD